MKRTSVVMAALAMAATMPQGLVYGPSRSIYTIPPRKQQPPKRMVGGSNAEIAKWNAEVDARKSAKKAAKIGEDV